MILSLKTRLLSLASLGLLLTMSACTTTGTKLAATTQDTQRTSLTLYEQLGGHTGVEKLSEQFIIQLAANERTRARFAKSDISRFHLMMQEHICDITNGPCEYSGDDMRKTHGGMNIQYSEFNAVVEALMKAMDTLKLPVSTQNRLLARLAPLRPEIVGH